MMLVTPADAKGPVPVMIMFGFGTLPGEKPPTMPGGRGFGRLQPAVIRPQQSNCWRMAGAMHISIK